MLKKLLIGLFVLTSSINPTTPEEASQPLQQSLTRTTTQVALPHNGVDQCLKCFPNWYHPCLGPIVTNIKYFDCDPYWVENRSPIFREIYTELEPLCLTGLFPRGRILREIHKLCIVRDTFNGREDRYDPISNWCANFGWLACMTMVPTGLGIGADTVTGGVLILTGSSWCITGCCLTAAWCALAKIHYEPRRPGILGYLRSPESSSMA